MTTGQRIKKLIDENGVTMYKLSQILLVTPTSVANWINDEKKPNKSSLRAIADYFKVSYSWLSTGKEMNDPLIDASTPINKKQLPGKENCPCADSLPLIPIEAVAGYLPGVDFDGVVLRNCDHYLVPEFQKIGAEFMIRVSGNSMFPTYANGDILACRMIQDVIFFQWGKVYILDTSQGTIIKRLNRHTEPDYVICVSDNKESYSEFDLPKSAIRHWGIILGLVRLE